MYCRAATDRRGTQGRSSSWERGRDVPMSSYWWSSTNHHLEENRRTDATGTVCILSTEPLFVV